MSKLKSNENNSVGFAKKYDELKGVNPFKIIEQKRKAYQTALKKYEEAQKEYWEYEEKLQENVNAYINKVNTELKPLAITMQDHVDVMNILD